MILEVSCLTRVWTRRMWSTDRSGSSYFWRFCRRSGFTYSVVPEGLVSATHSPGDNVSKKLLPSSISDRRDDRQVPRKTDMVDLMQMELT